MRGHENGISVKTSQCRLTSDRTRHRITWIKIVQMYFGMYPWTWGEGYHRTQLSSRSSSASSRESSEGDTGLLTDPSKRGRPRAEKISSLILQGSVSHSSIRCKICSRVFPREKSLQAHMRTHTGIGHFFCSFFVSSFFLFLYFFTKAQPRERNISKTIHQGLLDDKCKTLCSAEQLLLQVRTQDFEKKKKRGGGSGILHRGYESCDNVDFETKSMWKK